MPRKFTPRGDRILVRPIEKQAKAGGLLTPESLKEKPTTGIVLAAGRDAEMYYFEGGNGHASVRRALPGVKTDWVVNPFGVEIGQTIEWQRYAGHEMKINGEDFLLLRLEEVAGVWEDTDA
jgi:chaperonin GroES